MKFAIYRTPDDAIKSVHPIKNMTDNEIADAVKKHNADATKNRVEIVDAEDNGLTVYLWHAYNEKIKSLHSEIREAEDAADDLSRRLYSLREAAGDAT